MVEVERNHMLHQAMVLGKVSKASQPAETIQAMKELVYKSYYPCGSSARPQSQRYEEMDKRVSRKVIVYPGSAMEPFNNMSNWRGVYDPFTALPTAKYDYGSTNYGNKHYGGYGRHIPRLYDDAHESWSKNPRRIYCYDQGDEQGEKYSGRGGWKEPPPTPQGYYQTISHGGETLKKPSSVNGNYGNSGDVVSGNHGRLDDSLDYDNYGNNHYGGNEQKVDFNGSSGRNKPLSTQQGYDQPSNGGDTHRNLSSMNGNYRSIEGKGYGNRGKSDDSYDGMKNNPQAPRGKTSLDYDGGSEGTNQGSGYGDGVNTRRKPRRMSYTYKQDKPAYEVYGTDYNSSSRPNTARPAGTYPTVITRTDAANKYKGTLVP